MNRSLFTKYFITCTALILGSIVFLGAVLFGFASQYLKYDKQSVLYKQVKTAMEFTEDSYSAVDYKYIPKVTIKNSYKLLASAIDADIYFLDINGIIIVCSETNCTHSAVMISDNILETVHNNAEYFETGNLGGFLQDDAYYSVGIPAINKSGEIYGYIFASASASTQNSFLGEILKMFLISAVAVILISFVIIYFTTDKLVKPLREIASAARRFAKGDFAVTVPVSGYNEIAQLAMSFNYMAQALSDFEKTRRSFVANISHDLRTPMTTIGGFIDGILDGTIPKEKQTHYLMIVSDEVKRLAKLVRVMMNVAKIEAGEINLNLTRWNLVDVACKILFTFEQKIDSKNIEIKGLEHPAIFVNADNDLMNQVIYNLIDNAVKFVNPGGFIEFDFTVKGKAAYLSISNSGNAIKKEDLARIFDKFYKSDKSRGMDKTGVGLGLFIVKSIINAHGGDIIVNSVENKFCTFTFTVPLAPGQPHYEKNKMIQDESDEFIE